MVKEYDFPVETPLVPTEAHPDEPTAEEAVASEPEDAEVVEGAAPVELEEPKRWQVRAKASYPFHGQQFTAYTEEEVRAAWHKIYGEDYEIQDCFVIE